MPVFKYYNVQLLPRDTKTSGDVGEVGYKQLMDLLRKDVNAAVKKQRLKIYAYGLRNDMLFSPSIITPSEKFTSGNFIKFDSAGEVKDLYTNEVEFKGGPNSTSKKYSFRFVFDHTRHIMAVQNSDKNGSLPAASVFTLALKDFLKPIVESSFSDYELKVIELSSSSALDDVFKKACGYNRIEVELTFANSDQFVDAVVSQLKSNNVHTLGHIEKTDSPGKMGLSDYSRMFLNTAKVYGNASISYMEKIGKSIRRRVFHMNNHPLKKNVVQGTSDSEDRLIMNVLASIPVAEAESRRKV
ncbi:DUF4747 family protein [Ferribacterium limneticum]|uniref:DUF4747 family protein n=1 Tax=Ferribacterium limneticum TaxID=76259 RepID=UPI001CF92E7B|nr:DUF4747 family protein [Ferribacterium limneticum]UCV24080.1 DUF4747 family protein [Ferribacterium limneticum]